jgi:hypothetical protein
MFIFTDINLNTNIKPQIKTMYSLDEIYNIEKFIDDFKLPDITNLLIEKINSKVCNSNYIKTPIFNKKFHNKKDNRKNKKRNKNKEISTEQWDIIRNFENTKINKKNEGIEKDLNTIRILLNKLSDDNFDDILFEIKYKMNDIVPKSTKEDLSKVGSFIFETSSYNKFYSKLYAKIYGELINDYTIMKEVFDKNYKEFYDNVCHFEVANPDTDYELFCLINKKNEKRRGTCAFIANLANLNIISIDQICKNINYFIELFEENISKKDSTMITEEIGEILHTIIKECIDTIYKNNTDLYDDLKDSIETITEYNVKSYPSLNNKIIFKFMDILDIFEELEE